MTAGLHQLPFKNSDPMKRRNAAFVLASVAAMCCIGCSTPTIDPQSAPKGRFYSEMLPPNVNPTELVRKNGPYLLRIEKPIRLSAIDPVPEHYCLGSTEETLHSLIGPDIQLSDIAWYLDVLYEQVCVKQGNPSSAKNYCISNWHELGLPSCVLYGGDMVFKRSTIYDQIQSRWPDLFLVPGSSTTGMVRTVQFQPVIVTASWNDGQSVRNPVRHQPLYVVYLRYPAAIEDGKNGRPPRLGAFQHVYYDISQSDMQHSTDLAVPEEVTLSFPDGTHSLRKESMLTTEGDRFGAILVSLLNSLPEETLQSLPVAD